MSLESIARKARQAIIKTMLSEGIPGKLGNGSGTLYFTDKNGVTHRDQVWVRVSVEGTQTEIVAYCTAVNPALNLPVRVANRSRGPEVIAVDRMLSGSFTDGRMTEVPRHWWTHLWLGPDPAFLDSRSFMGLGVRPSDPPALTVDVKAGFYRYGGSLKNFPDTTSGSLSSYVPSTGRRHFVIICLDRENNALEIVDGTTKLIAAGNITRSEVAAVSVGDAYYPLAAVRLDNGQTEVRLPDIIYDMRLWAGELGVEAGGASASAIMTDADAGIMVDADGNVMIES